MKKSVLMVLIGIFLAVSTVVALPGFKTFRSKKMGIEFSYPQRYGLKVREKDGRITIEHSVKFKHPVPCDGGDDGQYLKKIYDFYATISILNKTATEIFRQEVMEVNEAGLVVGVKNSVRVTYGERDGFEIYNGNHGCGAFSSFFELSPEKFLQVDLYPAPEFREVPEEEKQIYYRLREIISPENEEHIFKEILNSLKWDIK